MRKQNPWDNSARYYDLIYSWKDYKREAGKIQKLIQCYKKSPGKDLLEVACGTGGHARYLKNAFRILGTDINDRMLAVARKNVKGVAFQKVDMLTLNLGRQFDVILCLFSSIGYMNTRAKLRKTLRNFSGHLKQGGVVIIEPWLTKAAYKAGRVGHLLTYDGKETKIARLNVSRIRGNVSILEMHHLVAEKDKSVKYFVERHEVGMFEPDEFLALMRATGLRARFLKSGLMKDRGLYVGVKR